MTLREELEDRADKLDAELLGLRGRMKEIERQSNDLHTCLNALDIAEMDAEDAALEPAPIPEPDDEAQRAAAIELTADVEPESVITDAVELTAAKLFDKHWNRKDGDTSVWPLSQQEPVIQEAWREKARELLAPAPPAVMEMMGEIVSEPIPQPEWNEGYAPVTNPDAEAQAKALDYYSPEKIAERNRFNPFAVFKREEGGL